MSDGTSVREQVQVAKAKIREAFEQKEMGRKQKLVAALAEYFADKWQAEWDIVQSDAVAQAVTEIEDGIIFDLWNELRDSQNTN